MTHREYARDLSSRRDRSSSAAATFQGINSLPLPGAVGRGPGASIYHVEIANVGTLGIEFAGDDGRRRGGQRRPDAGQG